MKRVMLISALLVAQMAFWQPERVASSGETYVYICMGPQAVKYHSTPKCKGLGRCSCEIVKVTKSKAEKKGFRECKLCYPKKK